MSYASAVKFITTNGTMMILSMIQYIICTYDNPLLSMLSFILKNLFLVELLNYAVEKYATKYSIELIHPVESFPHEFRIKLVLVSVFEYIEYLGILNFIKFTDFKPIHILYFIPISFIFELLFDFFHYWSHRIIHSNKTLYKMIHKMHHRNIILTPITTFDQHPLDLFLTNFMPNIFTMIIFQMLNIEISLFTYICILTYKSYIEISGHTGIEYSKSCSFPQFIWLPKIFGIELYSKNHKKHHTHLKMNYSKRFNIWDKIFCTWSPE